MHDQERGYGSSRSSGHHHHGGQRRGTPLSDLDPKLTEISRRVIGCAIEVHKELGPGFPRAAYLKALTNALDAEGVGYETDRAFKVMCAGAEVGEARCDLYIGERFLLTLLAEHRDIGSQERSELRAQLRAADLELGLIVNFGERRLKDGLVRVLNPDKLNATRAEREEHDEEDDDEYED